MSVAGEQVQELLTMLQNKLAEIEDKMANDQVKKDSLQRNIIKYTDDLEDLNNLLQKQRKLYKTYSTNLDETEQALAALNRSAGKFVTMFKQIAKQEGDY